MLLTILFFFFNDTATTEIYTLSLHDALPISSGIRPVVVEMAMGAQARGLPVIAIVSKAHSEEAKAARSEEHTSELQSRRDLVCRLLLEKKKKNKTSRADL